MIENDQQLMNTLEYLVKWANSLEGMRLCAEESSPNFFSQGATGPIGEIRKGLEEAQRYIDTRLTAQNSLTPEPSLSNGATHRTVSLTPKHQ